MIAWRTGEWVYFLDTNTDTGLPFVDAGKLVRLSHSLTDGEILTVDDRIVGRDLTHVFKSSTEAHSKIQNDLRGITWESYLPQGL